MSTAIRHFFVDAVNRPLWFADLTSTIGRGQIVTDPQTGDQYKVHSISSSPSGDKIVVLHPAK